MMPPNNSDLILDLDFLIVDMEKTKRKQRAPAGAVGQIPIYLKYNLG